MSLLIIIFSALAWGGELAIYRRAEDLLAERYLWPEDVSASHAFSEAAEAAEDAIPWLIVEPAGMVVHLSHGEKGEFARLDFRDLVGALAGSRGGISRALSGLEDAILALGEPIPADVDLPVELLRGASRTLDRHSVVLARDRLARFDERIRGKLVGIGSRIGMEDGDLMIKQVFTDSPAARAGLAEGDVVLRIDGMSAVGMGIDQAIDRIRGEEGVAVVLLVQRVGPGGEVELHEVEMVRAEVRIPNVQWAMGDNGIGVITVDHFSEQTARLMREALMSFAFGDVPLRGLILDLRGNSGGSMIQACKSADLLLEDGRILWTQGRAGERVDNLLREYRAHHESTELDVPAIVLVDAKSASASEIVAGALGLLDRAVLIGEPTHGKGTVQKLFTLRSGAEERRVRMKLTVAEYRLAEDTAIEAGVGLAPDLHLERAVFSRSGASLPVEPVRGHPPDGRVTWIDERQGWRDGEGRLERGDVPLALAERVLLASGSAHRQDVLGALESVSQRFRAEEGAHMVETLALRNVDWTSGEGGELEPEVSVVLQVLDPPVAGSKVHLEAQVRNQGNVPLYRVMVELGAEDRTLPWQGLTLPVGYLAPGGMAVGRVQVPLSARLPDREDEVTIRVWAIDRPPVDVAPAWLAIEGRPPPPLAVTARVVEEGDHHRVELEIDNRGGRRLTGLRASFALTEDAGFELIDREALLPVLLAHSDARMDLGIRLPEDPGPLHVELRMDAELFGRVWRQELQIPVDGGRVLVSPPTIEAKVPISAPVGQLVLPIEVRDDTAVADVTVWLDRQKVAWSSGTESRHVQELTVRLGPGAHTLVIEAVDEGGALSRSVRHIQGVPGDGQDTGGVGWVP